MINRKNDIEVAKRHFESIGLKGSDFDFAMERLMTTWNWIDNEKENV